MKSLYISGLCKQKLGSPKAAAKVGSDLQCYSLYSINNKNNKVSAAFQCCVYQYVIVSRTLFQMTQFITLNVALNIVVQHCCV